MKVTRDAFLYMDPSGPKRGAFGQCRTCKMNVPMPDGSHRCSILGIKIDGGDSCGLYVPGEQDKTEAAHIKHTVSPAEAGYVSRQVRCENCAFFDPAESECELFEMLSKCWPGVFELDEYVDPLGCCNAQTPIGEVELPEEDDDDARTT